MKQPIKTNASGGERRVFRHTQRPVIAGVPVRIEDIERTRGLHSVAILFRVLAALLGVIIVLEILNTVTTPVDISYGVVVAEVIRLVVFAALLWGAGALADLLVTSHHDLRTARILLARLAHQGLESREFSEPGAGGDSTH